MFTRAPLSAVYGWMMFAGIVVSIIFWSRLARRDERLVIIYLMALTGAFAGAKLVYLAAEGWLHFGAADMWVQLATGKSIVGALLGGYAMVELAKKFTGYPSVTGDWFATIVPIGVSLGRVGCLVNGCCLGEVCAPAWWALPDARGVPRWPAVPVELAFNLLAVGVFFGMRKRRALPGQHFYLYLIAYGTFRFLHEFLRATPKVFFGISGYQIAALLLVALGAAGFRSRAAHSEKSVTVAAC
jgi:phosphatidylglycerol:prolipoprotein diacylglycerol transferase